MYYRLEFEHDHTWKAFHQDQKTAAPSPLERRFERKYVWYLGATTIAVSPHFNTLREARHWFELTQIKGTPREERRKPFSQRRSDQRLASLAFASRFDRREQSGRRWTDQVAKFSF